MSDKYVLAMYDVRGKQEFIFRTNRLQEIVGASWIIRDIYNDYLLKSEKIYNYKGADGEARFSVKLFQEHMKDYIGEVVYEGGGNFLLLFKNYEAFKKTTYSFTKSIMKAIGTLQVLGTCVEIDDFSDFERDRKRLYRQHRINEAQKSSIAPWSCLPIVQVDRKTSQPLVDYRYPTETTEEIKKKIQNKGIKGKLSKESTAKLIKYYTEIQKIKSGNAGKLTGPEQSFYKDNEDILDNLVTEKGVDSQIAVVYIDGNNMGAKLQQATDGKTSYEKSIKALREFSEEIQRIYVKEGTERALSDLHGKDDKGIYRIVVSAGDEINFIVNAHDALNCANNYLDYLKNADKKASACAGIAVFHSHAPYADAYRIAEEACESGKQKMKKAELERASFIDFHICQGAIGISLDRIREEENGTVISRPWMMWHDGEPGKKDVKLTAYEDVKRKLDCINMFARSNVKGMLSAAKEGVAALQMELNRMYGHSKISDKEKIEEKWKELMNELNGSDAETVRAVMYDLALAYDLWFSKEAAK